MFNSFLPLFSEKGSVSMVDNEDIDQREQKPWPRGYKSFFMLNSAEHKIYPAHKC